MEVFATTTKERAATITGLCDGLTGKIDSVTIPKIQFSRPKLGDGLLAGAAESVLSVGSRVANYGLNALLDKIRGATDEAKGSLRRPVVAERSHADETAEYMQIFARITAEQITFVSKWIGEVTQKLNKCSNAEQVIELAIAQVMRLAGVEGDFKIEDLRQQWRDLGPMIDETTAWAKLQRDAALAEEAEDDAEAPGTQAALPIPPDDGSREFDLVPALVGS
jgi:hypothetical protein